MSSTTPPVPPEQRSDKGPDATQRPAADTTPGGKQVPENPEQQGQTGNTHINTTRKGVHSPA